MAEEFVLSGLVIPGTYIRVRAEALISVGGISSGNIGIVGTASQGTGVTHTLSDYESAKSVFGEYDAHATGAFNLMRGMELLYQNGARTVYARALNPSNTPTTADYTTQFTELLKDDVNILVAPELSTANAITVLQSLVDSAEGNGKDLIAVIGAEATVVKGVPAAGNNPAIPGILDGVPNNKRIIMTSPGINTLDATASKAQKKEIKVNLSGTYSAAAVAGLLSTLAPQTSATNKVLPGVTKLTQRFAYGETVDLLNGRICLLEERQGVRVVRGLTTDNGAFTQITTRRITDFAKAGIRQVSNPFIGRLNNQRVRKALQGAIDGFLTTMVQDEALIAYDLAVTATRQDEIAGRCLVNVTLQPTFSIDFIAVTMVLQ
jgi:Phage tail sheath C-terminal domain/Phage tail sheath protein subtilisin-like domain